MIVPEFPAVWVSGTRLSAEGLCQLLEARNYLSSEAHLNLHTPGMAPEAPSVGNKKSKAPFICGGEPVLRPQHCFHAPNSRLPKP